MRKRASVFLMLGVVIALQALLPIASRAGDGGEPEQPPGQEAQAGENRWVPSLAITGGATFQEQQGSAASFHYYPATSPTPEALRLAVDGDDLAVSPFVGGSLELMTPALPIPTRPRLFLNGEILPTFAADRTVALEQDPGCIRGPEPDAPCARDEVGTRTYPFADDALKGQGSRTTTRVEGLVFGASLGVAWPLRVGERQLRIKPSVGWIYYEVDAEGLVVDGRCRTEVNPDYNICTDYKVLGFTVRGYLRERTIVGSASQKFHGIGPGLNIEMDTGRFGPIGSSIFLGGGAYRVLGDRTFSFDGRQEFPKVYNQYNQLIFDDEVAEARFGVEVDPWIFRTHVGIRFQWLGSRQ